MSNRVWAKLSNCIIKTKRLNLEKKNDVVIIAEFSFDIVSGAPSQSFRVRPMNSSVLEGNEVTLQCEVNNRVGIVQWVKDGFAYVIAPSEFQKIYIYIHT